jgi:hypothetical protein
MTDRQATFPHTPCLLQNPPSGPTYHALGNVVERNGKRDCNAAPKAPRQGRRVKSKRCQSSAHNRECRRRSLSPSCRSRRTYARDGLVVDDEAFGQVVEADAQGCYDTCHHEACRGGGGGSGGGSSGITGRRGRRQGGGGSSRASGGPQTLYVCTQGGGQRRPKGAEQLLCGLGEVARCRAAPKGRSHVRRVGLEEGSSGF